MTSPEIPFDAPALPLAADVETPRVLKRLVKASRALAELKGQVKSIPEERILINTLGLQEAKDSSAIENIITTTDELYRAALDDRYLNPATKEVQNYVAALVTGFTEVRQHGLITNRTILNVQRELEKNNAGFRRLPGTALKSSQGRIVYTPPQDANTIDRLMGNLEQYINESNMQELDPIIKMAIIHYQFETIHPFYDGNGRTGRIINILYLVKEGLLDIPVLYLSHFIVQRKPDYYRLLQSVRTQQTWEEWILFILEGVEVTARQTIQLIRDIRQLMSGVKQLLVGETNFYSKELLEHLFRHPYTKIQFLTDALNIHRNTAASYLNTMNDIGVLGKEKLGKQNYYINTALFELLSKGFGTNAPGA